MALNEPKVNQGVATRLAVLREKAAQEPISYRLLFDEAWEIACDQLNRAIAAEAKLFKHGLED